MSIVDGFDPETGALIGGPQGLALGAFMRSRVPGTTRGAADFAAIVRGRYAYYAQSNGGNVAVIHPSGARAVSLSGAAAAKFKEEILQAIRKADSENPGITDWAMLAQMQAREAATQAVLASYEGGMS